MSNTKLKYYNPLPIPCVKVKLNPNKAYITAVDLGNKYESLFQQILTEIVDNDGIENISTRVVTTKTMRYDTRYINEVDFKGYIDQIFTENGFKVTFEYDNNL